MKKEPNGSGNKINLLNDHRIRMRKGHQRRLRPLLLTGGGHVKNCWLLLLIQSPLGKYSHFQSL